MSQAWIDEMAALWFVKVQDGLSSSEQDAFQKWLHVNPEHQKAYAQLEALWGELDGLSPTYNIACTTKKQKKYSWVYVACACVAVFFISLLPWQTAWFSRPEFAQNIVTPVGTIREYTLSDGTSLFLDTDTNVSIEYYKQKRLVKLHKGQIVLQVSKDTTRPFFVDAQNVQVRVTGTRFEVCNLNKQVRVSVEEGNVDVSNRRQEDGTVLKLASLHAKDQITLDERGFILTSSKLQNDVIAPWREGRLVFDKTPLQVALLAFERYGYSHVNIISSSTTSILLSGSFEVEKFEQFIEHLPKTFPVKVLHEGKKISIDKK